MILQIDAGNTRIHWRLRSVGGEVETSGVFAHGKPPDWPSGSVDWVELSTVAAAHRQQWLRAEIASTFGCPVYEAHTQATQNGLINSYANPESMGVDRWLAMLAAHGRWGQGVAVIDAGTAITVDYVDESGMHIGGYILPGVRLVLEVLNQETGRVRTDEAFALRTAPGHTTSECVYNGLGWTLSGMMQKVSHDCLSFSLSHVVITGGDGARLHALFPQRAILAPHLVLDGMDIYWGRVPDHPSSSG